MTALESPGYQIARDRIKGNPVISMMAAGVAAVPLAELAHEDGTPRFAFMQQANRAFDTAEAQNAGNPCYQQHPADAPRHLGLIAEAVLAERAAIREQVATTMAAPGTGPESGSLSSQRVEVLDTNFCGPRQGCWRTRCWRSACSRGAGVVGMATRPDRHHASRRSSSVQAMAYTMATNRHITPKPGQGWRL
jgi:hypothetical protein